MSGAIATAYVKLIPTFNKQLSSTIAKQLGAVDGKSAGSKLGKLFSRGVGDGMDGMKNVMSSKFSAATVFLGNVAAKAFSNVMGAVSSSMDAAINRVDIIENFPKVMTSLGYSAEESAASMNIMKSAVDGLPTRLQDMTTNVQTLSATMGNLATGEVNATTVGKAFNDMMLAGGQGTEAASNAFTQYTQMLAVGKVDQQAWNSVVTAAPGQMKILAESLLGAGASASDLKDAMQSGAVSFDDFNEAIVRLDKEGGEGFESFETQARNATKGIATSMDNARNRVTAAVAGIIQAIGQENIASTIEAITTKFGNLGKVIGGFDSEGNVVGLVAGLKRGLEPAFDGWEPSFSIDWDSAFSGAIEAAEHVGEWLSKPIAEFVKTVDEDMAWLSDVVEASLNRLNLPEIDWGAMADGVAAVVGALTDFSFDSLGNAIYTLATIGAWVQDSFAPAFEDAKSAMERMGQIADEFFAPIADFVTGNGPAFDGMMERIEGHIDDMGPFVEDIAGHLDHLSRALEPLAGPAGSAVAEALGNMLSAFVGLGTIGCFMIDSFLTQIDLLVTAVEKVGEVAGPVAEVFLAGFGLLPPKLQQVIDKAHETGDAIDGMPTEHSTTINVVDNASGVLGGIIGMLSTIGAGAVAHVTATGVGGFAAGGLSSDPIRRIPRHADGGMAGIAASAVLTNIGWVGEAGAEAIIPLTNKRYVRPFAQAVASEMGSGRSTVVNVNLDYKAGDDATRMARDVAHRLESIMNMGA